MLSHRRFSAVRVAIADRLGYFAVFPDRFLPGMVVGEEPKGVQVTVCLAVCGVQNLVFCCGKDCVMEFGVVADELETNVALFADKVLKLGQLLLENVARVHQPVLGSRSGSPGLHEEPEFKEFSEFSFVQ